MSSIFYSKRLFERKKSRGIRVRPKTFKTEETAKAFIKENGLKGKIEQKGLKFIISE